MTAQEKQAGMDRALMRWFFGWVAGGLGTVGMVVLQENPFPLGLIAVGLLLLGGMSWWIGLGSFLYYLCCPVDQPVARQATVPPPLPSVADQLTKLAELQRAGLLTVEEFELQKRSLLASS